MHIGKLIQDTLKEQGKTVVWFASRLSCHRTNVYKIFSKSSIDTRDLERISRILDYDFFSHYSQKLKENKKV
ncbi:MAG: XRE family transcriptional regulator [Ruminococcus sp.]|nr:XRE family transcriptional regulator [Ruminococcus sp.]